MTIYKSKKSIHQKPYTPFYYVIGWTKHDRWYVGSRTANSGGQVAHPDELMVTYFTTSPNYVHPFIEQHGLPDVVWTFPCKTREEASDGESRIMNEFHNFLPDERWLNKNKIGAVSYDDEIRDKMSKSAKKRPPMSAETREKISIAVKNRSDELKEKCMSGIRSRKHAERSDEWKIKQSIAHKGQTPWNKGLSGYSNKKRD